MNWQPIETAPKDGSTILLCGPVMVDYEDVMDDKVVVEVGQYSHNSGYHSWENVEETKDRRVQTRKKYEYDSWGTTLIDEPTHWMPLPEPPQEAAA